MKWLTIGLSMLCVVVACAAFWMIRNSPQIQQIPEPPQPVTAAAEPQPETNRVFEQPKPSVTWAQVASQSQQDQQSATREEKPSLVWQEKRGKCIDMALGGLIVVPLTGHYRPERPIDPATGREIVNIGTYSPLFDSYGPPFVLLNYPKSVIRQDAVSCKAVKVGSGAYKGKPIEVWDCKP